MIIFLKVNGVKCVCERERGPANVRILMMIDREREKNSLKKIKIG